MLQSQRKTYFQGGKVDERNALAISGHLATDGTPTPSQTNLSLLQFCLFPLPNKSTHKIFFPSNFIFAIPSNVVRKLEYVSWQCPFYPKPLLDLIAQMLINLCLG